MTKNDICNIIYIDLNVFVARFWVTAYHMSYLLTQILFLSLSLSLSHTGREEGLG